MAFFDIDKRIKDLSSKAVDKLDHVFERIDEISAYNSEKVLAAFVNKQVSESMFAPSTGYGYGDRGREVIDSLFAEVFGAEDALVRHNFVSGTHSLTVALFGVLRPGDTLLSITGKPYDTLEEVIGIREGGDGSLREFGIHYRQIDLTAGGGFDIDGIRTALQKNKVRMVLIQRSRGYSIRPSLHIESMRDVIALVKSLSPNTVILVDNCYGEFVEKNEPLAVGADLIVGSLIKNPGGGIAVTGGYIAGKKELVRLCSQRLTCPGIGKEVGATLGHNREIIMGLFMAPHIVAEALKTACFAAELFSLMGYDVFPQSNQPRTDIIQAIKLESPDALISFCQGMQKASPVDSFVAPEPWEMPGYSSLVIMASGAFTAGSSIELSADGPVTPPYLVYFQGGLTFATARLGIMSAANEMLKKGVLKI